MLLSCSSEVLNLLLRLFLPFAYCLNVGSDKLLQLEKVSSKETLGCPTAPTAGQLTDTKLDKNNTLAFLVNTYRLDYFGRFN